MSTTEATNTPGPDGGLILGITTAAMVAFFALLTVAIVITVKVWQKHQNVPSEKAYWFVQPTENHIDVWDEEDAV
jgi:hypothetical protein